MARPPTGCASIAPEKLLRALLPQALAMIGTTGPGDGVTLGSDKAYDTAEHVAALRRLDVTAHVTQNKKGRRSAIDGRTTRPCRLCGQPAHPQANRGSLLLDQRQRQRAQDRTSKHRPGGVDTHPHYRRLQPHSTPKALGHNFRATGVYKTLNIMALANAAKAGA